MNDEIIEAAEGIEDESAEGIPEPLDHAEVLARFQLASDAWGAAIDGKAAETADLDPVAFDQGITHRVENRLDGKLGIAVGELAEPAGQCFHKVAAGHD